MDQKAMNRRSRRLHPSGDISAPPMLTAEHDALIQDEIELAKAIQNATPGMSRDDALRTAARMLDRSNFLPK